MLSYKDCLLYLRGLFHVSMGHINEAFKDFYSIESNTLFPKQLIQDEIFPTLTHVQKVCIQTHELYKTANEYRKINEHHGTKIFTSLSSIDLLASEYDMIEDSCKKNLSFTVTKNL